MKSKHRSNFVEGEVFPSGVIVVKSGVTAEPQDNRPWENLGPAGTLPGGEPQARPRKADLLPWLPLGEHSHCFAFSLNISLTVMSLLW